MSQLQTKKTNPRSKVKPKTREAVLRHYGHRCYYPNCTLPIGPENPLCIHDITDTGVHNNMRLMRPVCRTHHNQATANARSAKVKMAKFRRQGIQIGTTQDFLFEQEFYGTAKQH